MAEGLSQRAHDSKGRQYGCGCQWLTHICPQVRSTARKPTSDSGCLGPATAMRNVTEAAWNRMRHCGNPQMVALCAARLYCRVCCYSAMPSAHRHGDSRIPGVANRPVQYLILRDSTRMRDRSLQLLMTDRHDYCITFFRQRSSHLAPRLPCPQEPPWPLLVPGRYRSDRPRRPVGSRIAWRITLWQFFCRRTTASGSCTSSSIV